MNTNEKDSIVYLVENWDKYDVAFKDKYQSQEEIMEKSIKSIKSDKDDSQQQAHDAKLDAWVRNHHQG